MSEIDEAREYLAAYFTNRTVVHLETLIRAILSARPPTPEAERPATIDMTLYGPGVKERPSEKCPCSEGGPVSYEGPLRDCPVHGSGSAPRESDPRCVPDPLPEVLPAGTRFDYGDGQRGYFEKEAELHASGLYYCGATWTERGPRAERGIEPRHIDWSSVAPSAPNPDPARPGWKPPRCSECGMLTDCAACSPGYTYKKPAPAEAASEGCELHFCDYDTGPHICADRCDGHTVKEMEAHDAGRASLAKRIEAYERFVEWLEDNYSLAQSLTVWRRIEGLRSELSATGTKEAK